MTATHSPSAKMIIVLTVIAALSGGILAAWDSYTAPKIALHREAALQAAIKQVLPPFDSLTTRHTDRQTFYFAHQADSVVGVAFEAVGNGFQGQIRMMVGFQPNLKTMTGLQVLEQVETPGLGTRIADDPSNKTNAHWFTQQFRGLTPLPEIIAIKNAKPSKSNEIQAITGATISSQSVVRIMNQQIETACTGLKQLTGGQDG